MSKQYKFRGYDKVNKRMFEVYGLGVDWCTENTFDGVNENHNCWDGESFKKSIVIMQFIDLYDKHKVEIYDGDICEVDNNENASHLQTVNCNYAKRLQKGDLLVIKKLLSGYTGQILSNQGEAPNLIGNVSNYSLWNGARQLKVIGNIYLNPELINS